MSENDRAYLKAEKLEAGLRRAETKLQQSIGYQRHMSADRQPQQHQQQIQQQ